METKRIFRNRSIIALPLLLSMLFVLVACSKEDNNDSNSNTMYTISGNANGSQMVPAVSGSGTATISGTYNANTRVLDYTANWSNLTGAPTSAAFYSGATGVNGTIIGSPWTLGTGLTSTENFSGSTTLTTDQEAQLIAGNWYYVLSTTTNATGEVRGQITATPQ